jgi:hypothetical protein
VREGRLLRPDSAAAARASDAAQRSRLELSR